MTTFADLAIADGQATPVTQTFKKVKSGDGIDPNSTIAIWEDRSPGYQVGFRKISQMMRWPSKNLRSTRILAKITAPVMETVSNSTVSGIAPAPTVSYTPLCNIEVVLPERSGPAARADLYAFLKNYVQTNEFKNAVLNLDPVN